MKDHDHDDGHLPDALRWSLRGMRRDEPPARDLWPDIAARLQALPQSSAKPARNRFVPSIALAASLALAVGLAWQQRPAPGPGPDAQLISAEADAMTREYQAALRELQGTAPRATGNASPNQASLAELDRSAAQIRTALTRDPGARFLLARLQHTYARRLDLTQRLALS